MARAFANPDVAAAFDKVNPTLRRGLLRLRDMVFDIATDDPRIGPVMETLRWRQPAYLTPVSKSGTTLRLGLAKTGEMALFVHCRTCLISDYKAAFPGRDRIEGTRAVLFDTPDSIDPMRHGWLIRRALTYHL